MTGAQSPRLPALVAVVDDERLTRPDFATRLEAVLAGGCPAVWLRARRLSGPEVLDLGRDAVMRAAARDATVWISDRPDVARAAGAAAVQLPSRGMSVADARRAAGDGLAVGRSVHSVEAAERAAAEGADWLVVGTIYPTSSHPGRPAAGPNLLIRIREALGGSPPLCAIGGLTVERVAEARAAGADAVAVLRALWDVPDPTTAARAFRAAFDEIPGTA